MHKHGRACVCRTWNSRLREASLRNIKVVSDMPYVRITCADRQSDTQASRQAGTQADNQQIGLLQAYHAHV